MSDIEISRDKWALFCEAFSIQHQGWLATLEVHGSGLARRINSRALPFRGVSCEVKGTGQGDIVISLDRGPNEAASHRIDHPTTLRLEQVAGQDQGLEVEGEDGTKTILRFYHPARPEMVDGI